MLPLPLAVLAFALLAVRACSPCCRSRTYLVVEAELDEVEVVVLAMLKEPEVA